MSTVQVAALPRRFVDAFTHGVDPEAGHVAHRHRGTDGRWCPPAAQWEAVSGPPGQLTAPKRL